MNVSIIMAVYNGKKNIQIAIESILNQTFQDFEFIIVDDGSNDGTLDILKNYAKQDNRIKIIKNFNNIGITKSLNVALKYCNSDLIARQDVDNVSLPSRLEKQVNFLSKNTKYAFCGCNGYFKQDKNNQLINHFEFKEIKNNMIVENCFIHSSILIKKSILDKYGFYDESFHYGQDYEMWCRLIYRYNQMAKNLREKLIIRDKPYQKLLKKEKKKFFIQRLNALRVQFKYLKYAPLKLRAVLSILIRFIEMITISHIMEFLSKSLNHVNI